MMYEENNQYRNFSNMPYDSTVQNKEIYGEAGGGDYGKAPKSGKKGGGLLKKLGISAACALVFGCVAGVTMTGVHHITGGTARSSVAAESTAGRSAINEENSLPFRPEAEKRVQAPAETEAGSSNLDVSAIVEKAMPSVVAISVKGEQKVSDWFGRSQTYEITGAGSGILIGENDDEYLIVTNNHVVEKTTSMSVQFIDGQSADAELKGTDSGVDVAVIAVKKADVPDETREQIKLAEIGDSKSLKVGQGVIAIGNALGYGQSVTVGYVSAINRTITAQDASTGAAAKIENLLQTDAAINPGNSGGALLNMQGQVIGINESKSVDTTVEGMGYAIPISSVTELIGTLSTQKTRAQVAEKNRGYIGFQGQNVDQEAAQKFNMPVGIFVYKILENGAAANSELQESDIITRFEGQTVSSIEELKEKLTRYEKGETVTLTVQRPEGREYKEIEVSVTLAAQGSVEGAGSRSGGARSPEEDDGGQDSAGQEENGPEEDWNSGSLWEDFFNNGGFQFRW